MVPVCSHTVAAFGSTQARLVVGLIGGSHVVNHMYFMVLPPITAGLGTDLGLSTGEVGIAIGLVGGLVTLLQLPLGHLSDTKGRTPLLAVSLTFGALGAVLVATAGTYRWLLVGAGVIGIGVAAHHPAHYPLLSEATATDARGRAFSIHGFTGAVGFAAPPGIIAAASWLGFGWRAGVGAIAVAGALYGLVCLYAVVRFVDDDITAPSDTSRADDPWTASRVVGLPVQAIRGFRSLLSSRGIVLVTILWLVTSMAAWGIKSQTLPLLAGGYGMGDAAANVVVSAMLFLGAVTMLGGGWLVDRTSPGLVLTIGYVALVAITGVLATGMLPVLLAVGLTLVLASTVDYSRPARAALADRFSSSEDLGKNFGLVTIGISGGSMIAPPVLGLIADVASIEAAFAAMAVVGLLSLVLLGAVIREDRIAPVAIPQPGDD